jgi:hypothetical protein
VQGLKIYLKALIMAKAVTFGVIMIMPYVFDYMVILIILPDDWLSVNSTITIKSINKTHL